MYLFQESDVRSLPKEDSAGHKHPPSSEEAVTNPPLSDGQLDNLEINNNVRNAKIPTQTSDKPVSGPTQAGEQVISGFIEVRPSRSTNAENPHEEPNADEPEQRNVQEDEINNFGANRDPAIYQDASSSDPDVPIENPAASTSSDSEYHHGPPWPIIVNPGAQQPQDPIDEGLVEDVRRSSSDEENDDNLPVCSYCNLSGLIEAG